jgi:hypothetical protein
VPPKPPRATLVVEPGRVVVVVVPGAGVWVAVRVNAGRDQWPPLLVRVQPELVPPPPQERRGGQFRAEAAPGTAVDVAAGGLPAGGQFCGGVIA